MIYLISFIESFCGGLIGINLVLYLKYILKFNEIDAGWFMSGYGLISSLLIFLLGPAIDKYGIKKCALIGSSLLIVSRLGLGLTANTVLALIFFLLAAIGSAIKSSSITVFLKQQNKSFKFDYLVFNLAYFFAGILFDELKDYQLTYFLAGLFNIVNLGILFKLKTQAPEPLKLKLPIDWKIFRMVIAYNCMLLPVNLIFVWMNSGLPKWVLEVLGPNAPVGKIYGSLNPLIILLTIPLVAVWQRQMKNSVRVSVILGSLISASSMFLILLPLSYLHALLISIVVFTIGEAIWSPANMEMSARICPEGQEGRYMTLSLIPSMISRMGMGWLIAFSLTHYVYSPITSYTMPFLIIGALALLTPISLSLFKHHFGVSYDKT